ncbi:MAG: response regulator transcription factor, partial [Alphaproteobacteria bacterium]|nr:response regulator transcription factor [Alphaproteobacteria bacterium]
MALAYDYDIIILDLTLADIQAYRMLHRLRAAPVRTPLLILSARDELDRNIKSRGLGADEFLAKPFGSRELSARVRAIMRRSKAHRSTVRTGKLMVNLATGGVSVNGQPVRLTLKEYCILELLSLRKGTVLKKAVFLD